MAKKLKELKKGDTLYYIEKDKLAAGVQKDILCRDWEEFSDYTGSGIKVELIRNVSWVHIPKSSMSQPVSSQLYTIYGTSPEAVIYAAQKFIDKGLERFDKLIALEEERLECLKKQRKGIANLLKK